MAIRLLIDENLSDRLVRLVADIFPDSQHVLGVGLAGASYEAIWQYAAKHHLVLATKDEDAWFHGHLWNGGAMRLRAFPLALAALVALTACGSGSNVTSDYPPPSPAPTAVGCTDAPQLRQRAVDDRRQSDELNSDHEKIYIGNRAGFFASLAIIADLKCKVTLAEADEALKPAFEAARKAEDTSSTYEMAIGWGEADFIATGVIALLIQELPAAGSK